MSSPHPAGAAALYIAAHGKPTDKAGVDVVRNALIADGTPQTDLLGFTDDPATIIGKFYMTWIYVLRQRLHMSLC